MELAARSVRFSETTLTELMIPSYANFGGKIHGGILLSLIDKVAYACASRHASNYCVTVSVDAVDFLEPVEVGDLLSLMASVNYVGKTSLVIGIKVIAENVRDGLQPLLLENEADTRRFLEAMKRKELKEAYRDAFANARSAMHVSKNIKKLSDQRCVVGYKTKE
jgi:uncharacterized protein (TIGR00369 family)